VTLDGAPRELYALRPDRMSIEAGRNGWPAAFVYRAPGGEARYDAVAEGVQPILHIRLFSPLDDHYGFAPLAAAQVALDTHNAASFWNKALLDNSARPSGALVYSGPDGAHLTDEQFTRLKQELEENFSGADNAGRPLLLEGGLDWRALSLSPKDMDFAESKATAAREIALAFGVPPLLLGLPGDNTFANYSEANRAFWRQTVLPLVARVQKSFAAWLQPAYPPFRLDYNADRLEALAVERAAEWSRIGDASFLTLDEQREAVGYGPAPKDALFGKWRLIEARYSPDQPRVPAGSADGGQWTSGGGGGGGGGSEGGGGGISDAIGPLRPNDRSWIAQFPPPRGSVSLLDPGANQVALNVDPNVANDAGNFFDLAQFRPLASWFSTTFLRQNPRLSEAIARAEPLVARARQLDSEWKLPATLIDPNDVEGQIKRFEFIAQHTAEFLAENVRVQYGDSIIPTRIRLSSFPLRGPMARIRTRDAPEVRRGAERENDTALILALNGYEVEQKPEVEGNKKPDYRINGEIFDNYAPSSEKLDTVWEKMLLKIEERQTQNIILNLRDTPLTPAQIITFLQQRPVPGLVRLWVIDRGSKLVFARDPLPMRGR
jgi:HK97 family phage portal protein